MNQQIDIIHGDQEKTNINRQQKYTDPNAQREGQYYVRSSDQKNKNTSNKNKQENQRMNESMNE